MSKSLILVPIAAMLVASTSWAEGSNYSRPGWYAGFGAGAGWDFLEEAVSDATGGAVEITPGGSFNARGGYRATSWFAIELMYEGVYSTGVEVLGANTANFDTHSFLGNLKFILPIWRIQPYFGLGPGAQFATFDGRGALDPLDTTRWDFVLRVPLPSVQPSPSTG